MRAANERNEAEFEKGDDDDDDVRTRVKDATLVVVSTGDCILHCQEERQS